MATPTDPRAHLRSLLTLINSATEQAIAQYDAAGNGLPTLEHPHPSDTILNSTDFRKTIKVLEGACEQLCSTLAQPCHTMYTRSMIHHESACIVVAAEARVADILLDYPDGLHVDELSKQAHIEPRKLARVLSLLATKHCFREVAPDVFANTRLSRTLAHDRQADICSLVGTELGKASAFLYDALADPEDGFSFEPARAPVSHYLKHVSGAEKDSGDSAPTLWTWYSEHPERSAVFDRALTQQPFITLSSVEASDFAWRDLPKGTKVCDIGGGVGGFCMEIARAYPGLDLTLQDLPHVIGPARQIWHAECPEAVEEDRIHFVAMDFLKESPVGGQDVYYLRRVMHDWADHEATLILDGVRKVMSPETRLLIQDIVLPHVYQDDNDSTQRFSEKAPSPLLPNYGAGSMRAYCMDIGMLSVMNGGERTLEEWVALGLKAGLELRKATDLTEVWLMEFGLAST
ncbi:hypothetical protein PLICRDRAFT_692890 [Plicaturopsis crispa FD-325 SS-3]|nr:hypothetical protein PLICRDRAFT_692890 [Plicaturopsis crispa FD-325 SS-3]